VPVELSERLRGSADGGRLGRPSHLEEGAMPKYLIEASYTREGVAGVLAQGGTNRRDAAAKTVASLGGQLESIYFAFGDRDVIVIADMPDNEAAAVAMAVNASGGLVMKTTPLLTPEQVDEATKRSVDYRPPGS
jgi:uncharacterized protein with GYD domain